MRGHRISWALGLVAVVFAVPAVVAHQGYFTTYSHHVEPGEVEMMFFLDHTRPSDPKEKDGQGEYLSQMLEFKYNPTDQLALEWMIEGFQDLEGGDGKFTGARYEARYRLFRGEVPLNPMLYAEFEDLDLDTRYKMEVSGWVLPPFSEVARAESHHEKIIESRLILSQDFGRYNAAFNWINESDLDAGETAFGYSLGLRYDLHGGAGSEEAAHHEHRHEAEEGTKGETAGKRKARTTGLKIRPAALSFELFGALGDERKLDLRPARQEHYLQPSLGVHVGEKGMLNLGFGMGLTDSSDELVRIGFGWKF